MRASLGINERRTLTAVAHVLATEGHFPTVDEIAATPWGTNRGHASNALRRLEARGAVARSGFYWRTGTIKPWASALVQAYREDEVRWLPRPKKAGKRPTGATLDTEGTLHPHRVRFPATGRPLRPGTTNQKLGGHVTKGRWAGARILTLALEERRTCPASCDQWISCYGNGMNLALRTPHGPTLEALIRDQLSRIRGEVIVVRLHELGDFYSLGYVALWREMLDRYPWLHVFGYTAWTPRTPIGGAIQAMNAAFPERCWIRTSGHGAEMAAYVVKPGETRPDAFACPEQSGRVANCGACGACWSTRKNVSFEEH